MDEPRDCHSQWSKTEKDKYYDITYMWNLKKRYKWIYLQNRYRVTDVETKLELLWSKGGWVKGEIEIDIYPLLYIK